MKNDLTKDIAIIRKSEYGKRVTRLYNEGYITLYESMQMLTDCIKPSPKKSKKMWEDGSIEND